MSNTFIIVIVTVIAAILSYLLGSISTAVIFTKMFAHTDVREHGSGNAGLTNVLRTAGKLPGALTLICDFGKAVAAVAIGRYAAYAVIQALTHSEVKNFNPIFIAYICGFFCVLGHIYPIYFNFKGGKGALTSLGTVLLINWQVFLIVLAVFIITLLIFRIVSVSSISGAIAFPITTLLIVRTNNDLQYFLMVLFSCLFAILVIVKHKENIKRIFKGEEKKLSLKKKGV